MTGMTKPDMTNPEERESFKASLKRLLGGEWPTPPKLDAELIESHDRGDHTADLVSYTVEPGERVRAWLLRPAAAAGSGDDGLGTTAPDRTNSGAASLGKAGKGPAIAVWHQHNGEYHLGKGESAGFAGNPMHHTGLLLVRKGYIVLCPDAAGFEDRRSESLEGMAWERHLFMKQLWAGRSLAWKNILDCRRAIDYLVSLTDVDENRIGCYGHSLGSTFAWLTAPWDNRLRCVVGNCCMPSIAAMEGEVLNHSFSNSIPGLGSIGDIPDVVSLIAPRRLHLNFGAADSLNPIAFIEKELPGIADVYRSMSAEKAFSFWIDREVDHALSDGMAQRMLRAFKDAL